MLDWSDTEPTAAAQIPAIHALRSAAQAKTASANDANTGLIDRSGGRVSVDEKRMINCRADVNQLLPLKYKWA
jgi:ribonucleoside-diphosphate reductase beta chain